MPTKLTLSFLLTGDILFEEGDSISLKINGEKIFYGYIFERKTENYNIISIIAYDQIRYLLCKDTYIYKNKSASQVIEMICLDFMLKKEIIENTNYVIPYRLEENQSILDIIYTALDITTRYNSKKYVFYDNFGKLCLKNIYNMKLPIIFDLESSTISYSNSTSIDKGVYNSVKVSIKDRRTKLISIYKREDEKNKHRWGTLRLFERLPNTFTKAQAENYAQNLLNLKNKLREKINIQNIGDSRVRGGSIVDINIRGSIKTMIVESCVHTIENNEHMMKLTLINI